MNSPVGGLASRVVLSLAPATLLLLGLASPASSQMGGRPGTPSTKLPGLVEVAIPLSEIADAAGLDVHPLHGTSKAGGPALWDENVDVEMVSYHAPPNYVLNPSPRPLLVAYHSLGSDHTQPSDETTLVSGASRRGWLYVSLQGADLNTWPSSVGLLHVDGVVAWMGQRFSVDADRIYMIGKSLGAQMVGTYAATRKDPVGTMVAAAVLVAPVGDMRMWWSKLDPSTGTGMPGASPWLPDHRAQVERADNMGGDWGIDPTVDHRYRIAGILHHQPGSYLEWPNVDAGGLIDPTRSLARNLGTLPLMLIYDVDDGITLVPSHAESIAQLATGQGNVTKIVLDQELVDPHSWGILPVSTALDFLSSHGVERSPPVFRVVAHDDVPFGFTVPRRGNLDDTSSYDVITLPTGFSISRMERLAGIALDVSLSQHDGLIPSPGHPMRIELESAVDVEVVGLGFTPGIVAGSNIGSYQIQSMAVTVQPAGPGPMTILLE